MTTGDPMRSEAETTDRVVAAVCENAKCSVIVVCSTKRSAEATATAIASALGSCVKVACVHGGMGYGERVSIEHQFQSRAVSVLCVIGTALILRGTAAALRADIVILKSSHKYVGSSRFEPYTAGERGLFRAIANEKYIECFGRGIGSGSGRNEKGPAVQRARGTQGSAKEPIRSMHTHAELLEMAAKASKARIGDWDGRHEAIAKMAESNSVRFPPPAAEMDEKWAHVSVAAQASVAGAVPADLPRAVQSDCRRAAHAMAAALGDIVRSMKSGTAVRNALELQGALSACAWHDDPARVLTQIDGIGAAYGRTLVAAGIADVSAVCTAGAGRVQAILGRNPPFGADVVRSASGLPVLDMDAEIVESETLSLELSYNVYNCSVAHLLVVVDDRAALRRTVVEGDGRASVRIAKRAVSVVASIMSAQHAGVNIHRVIDRGGDAEIRPTKRRRQSTVDEYVVPGPSSDCRMLSPPSSTLIKSGCRHRCADRQACGHACCKTGVGVLGNHAALVRWLSQFRHVPDAATLALSSYTRSFAG